MIKMPHQVNDRFELLELLGSGSFSEVYLARDRDPGNAPELVAFKLFRSLNKGRGLEQTLSSFEFQMLSRLRHPNLAMVYDYGVDSVSGRAWFTMELLTGVDFLEAVSGMQPLETLPLVVATCRALHHIHTRGLIHHDLKPGNLIVTSRSPHGSPLDRPVVKLTDFGLSTPFDKADDGHLRGTPEYMAPEMLAGLQKDHRCDLYSLGVLLYVSLSGRLPFPEGRRPGTEKDSPPQLRGRNNEPLPAFLEDLVDRLLQADPDNRYQTANDVIKDLGLYTGTAWALEPGAVGASSAAADTVLTISPAELEGLRQRLEKLGTGESDGCRPALLIGNPGEGKSHLVMELRRLAQTSGAGFLFAEAVEDVAGKYREQAELANDLFEQFHRVRRPQGSGVAVVLDAEQQGAATIAAVLQQVALHPGQGGEDIFLLVTGTPGRPATEELLSAHAHGTSLEQIRLRPLDLERMARFLSVQLGSQVAAGDRLSACVLAESDGIPRLAEEALAHLQASGALTLPPSGPCFDPDQHLMDFTLPTGHLLNHHQPTADDAGMEWLQALAVFGAPATARMVAELLNGTDEDEAAVDRALAGDGSSLLIRSRADDLWVYEFNSLFLRNMVRGNLSAERRREFHRRAAAALQRGIPTPGNAPEALIWRHLMMASQFPDAWRRGLEHGRKLEEALRFEEAGRVYETLISNSDAGAVPPEVAVELILRATNLLRAAGRIEEARARLEQGEAIAESAGLNRQLARLRLAAGYILEKQGDLEAARKAYLRGLEELPVEEAWIRGDLLLQLGLNALWSERFEEADTCLADCRKAYQNCGHTEGDAAGLFLEASIIVRRQQPDAAIELLQQFPGPAGSGEGGTVMMGRLRVLLGELLYHQNRFDEADRLFADGMKIFKDRGERSLEAITLANLGALHFEQGRFSVAGRYNLDCLRAHEEVGNRYGQALSQYNLGICDYHRGRYAEALEHLRTARGIHEYLGDAQGLAQCMNMEAELYLTLGDTSRAAQRLQASAAALHGGGTGYTAADRLLLEAELTLSTGQPEEAKDFCHRARDIFSALGDTRQLVRAALLTSRCLTARGRAPEAEAVLVDARSRAAEMSAPRLGAELVLAESELRNKFGLGPTHGECALRCRKLLDDLAEVEDPEFLQSLFAALGRHLEKTGHGEEAMAALHQAFQMLRKVAGRFDSQHAEWKSGYLSAPHRTEVIRKVAEWSRKKNRDHHSSNG